MRTTGASAYARGEARPWQAEAARPARSTGSARRMTGSDLNPPAAGASIPAVPRAALLFVVVAAGCARSPAPVRRAPSVLLVTVDTLRADRLGCYGDERARTPTIDRLARAGTLFENAFTPVPITLASHASILTGLIPPAHGVRGNGGFALGPVPTLATALRSRGLATGAFVG